MKSSPQFAAHAALLKFHSGACSSLPALCCQAERKTHQSGWRVSWYTGTPVSDQIKTIASHFVCSKVVRYHLAPFCYNVGGSGVWILEWGGLNQPLPSPPGMQGWRCRCLVLPSSVHLKPGWPHGGGHLLRLDAHTLGRSFRKGSSLAGCFSDQVSLCEHLDETVSRLSVSALRHEPPLGHFLMFALTVSGWD